MAAYSGGIALSLKMQIVRMTYESIAGRPTYCMSSCGITGEDAESTMMPELIPPVSSSKNSGVPLIKGGGRGVGTFYRKCISHPIGRCRKCISRFSFACIFVLFLRPHPLSRVDRLPCSTGSPKLGEDTLTHKFQARETKVCC